MTDPTVTISAADAAKLFVQGAFLKCGSPSTGGNGARMIELLMAIHDAYPKRGGGFRVDGTECHPNVPGCNKPMADWLEAFRSELLRHISIIRTGPGPHPVTEPKFLQQATENKKAKQKWLRAFRACLKGKSVPKNFREDEVRRMEREVAGYRTHGLCPRCKEYAIILTGDGRSTMCADIVCSANAEKR